jgi:hypothetical protein
VVPFHAVGREIGEPDKAAGAGVADGQRAAVGILVIAAIGPAPAVAVFGDARAVIGPAAGIGAALQSGDAQRQVAARFCRHAEMEPLRKFRFAVLADRQFCLCPIDFVDNNIAAVERGVDVENSHAARFSGVGE